jgi:hypothetical protein
MQTPYYQHINAIHQQRVSKWHFAIKYHRIYLSINQTVILKSDGLSIFH